MSKITLAFGSLVFGVVLGSLFFGNQTVTLAQSVSGITLDCNGVPGCVPFGLPNKQPSVPGLGPPMKNMGFVSGMQPIDGLDCSGCFFENTTLLYSGGAFKLTDAKVNGNVRIEFSGAAANTLALLQFLTSLSKGQKPSAPLIPKPDIRDMKFTSAITNVNWNTPFNK
jgi:hypothetical protein